MADVASIELDMAAVRERARDVCARAQAMCAESTRIRQWARAVNGRAALALWPRVFVVRGTIEQRPVRAFWSRGTLVAGRTILDRAEVLVAMGEVFDVESGQSPFNVVAGLKEPIPALLTLMRACDQVNAVQIGPMTVRAGGGACEARPASGSTS